MTIKTSRASYLRYWAAGVLLVAIGVLYLFTLDNGLRPNELQGGDLITHQYAQVEGRPSNAPGYPLYTMGGWLWFRVGQTLFGWMLNPIQVLSLYSTLWGLASLLVLYLILLDIFARRWLPALLLTAFHATTFFFWYYSVTTEQYTSAVFQTLLIIWLAFRWDESPRDSLLLGMAFVSGTMLANMVTTLFILPPLLWFILSRKTSTGIILFDYLKRPKLLLKTVGVTALPLLSYLYIYIRGAQHPEWRGTGEWQTAWAWFVDFLTIQQGRDELAPGLRLQDVFTGEFPLLMVQELTWPIFVGGLLGLVCLGRRRAIFLYGTLAIYLIFCWSYRFGNWFQVIIPAYPIFTIGFAAGLSRISELTRARLANTERRRATGAHLMASYSPFLIHSVMVLLLAALLGYRLVTNFPQANQHNRPGDTGLDPGWAILADKPALPALISSSFEEQVALEYLSKVWHAAPGIAPAKAGDLTVPPGLRSLDPTLYISRQAIRSFPHVIAENNLYPQAAGEKLIALEAAPRTKLSPTAQAVELDFGDALQLLGWEEIISEQLPATSPKQLSHKNWQLALYWQARAELRDDFTVSVRPLVEGQHLREGEEAIIQDHQPVWGAYPTSQWPPHVIIRDVYALNLPNTPDAVQIVVYKSTEAGFQNLAEQTIALR